MALPTTEAAPYVTANSLTSDKLAKEVSIAELIAAVEKAEKKKKKAKATITKKKNALVSDLFAAGIFERRLSVEDKEVLKEAFANMGRGVVTYNCDCHMCTGILKHYKLWRHSDEAKLILAEEKKSSAGVGLVEGNISNVGWDKIKTQKALGIKACMNIHPSIWAPGLNDLVYQDIFLYPHNPAPKGGTWFARPCPETPKHGFVESRVVYPEQVKGLYEKVLKHDPKGELILMPFFSGEYSGVATESVVAFGKGNDGVTGKGKGVVSIPVSFEQLTIPYHLIARMKLKHAYLEVVEHEGKLMLVQLRDGPKPPPALADYIPKAMTVRVIIRPEAVGDDLLKWEGCIQKAITLNGGTDGVVVWLPGGSLASHWAVHAITHKVAVVTSMRVLSPDMEIKPTSVVPSLTDGDLEWLADRMKRWVERDYVTGVAHGLYAKGTIGSAVAMVQQQHLWGTEQHLMELRAAGIVSLIRFLSAACVGEVRYYMRNGPGSTRGVSQRTVLRGEDSFQSFGRSAIYSIYLRPVPLEVLEETMRNVFNDFMEPGWRNEDDKVRFDRDGEIKGPQHYGYGGPKWGNSAAVTEVLIRRARQFIKDPTAERWAALMKQANFAVNTAHNNGQVLSKWLNGHFFDNVTKMPAGGFLNAFTARVCLGLQMQGVGCDSDEE